MAIRPCKECGKDISTSAPACPHCGAKPRRTSLFTWIVAIFLGLMFASWIRVSTNNDNKAEATAAKAATLTPEQRAAAQKQAAQRQLEGKRRRDEDLVAYACKDWVKKSLHDPDSAKFEDPFSFMRTPGYDRVQVQVRARNAFNAIRLSTFECRIRRKDGIMTLVGIEQLP